MRSRNWREKAASRSRRSSVMDADQSKSSRRQVCSKPALWRRSSSRLWSLRHLAGRALSHPDSRRTSPLPAPSLDEPPQRRVRDPAASARKQLMDAGHLQTVGGQPLVDLVRPGDKDILGRRLHLPRGAQVQPGQATQLILTRSSTVACRTRSHGRHDVPADCCPRQPRTGRYLPLAVARLPAAHHFCYLHSRHLPVRHRCSLHPGCSNGRQSGAQGGQTPWRSGL